MSLGVTQAAMLLKMDDGRVVQRPLNTVETDIICAMLCEHDTKILRTFPAEGIVFKSNGGILKT